jgi:hypothetical protein
MVTGCAHARARPIAFTSLNAADQPLRDAFNRERDKVRVVMLVSPTCPYCLEGTSEVEHSLFATDKSAKLAGFVVWVPMLSGTIKNVPGAAALAPDPRMLHYWDGSNDLGFSYGKVLPTPGGPAWDVYMLYAPGTAWRGLTPPKPNFWMHQLNITNAPRLNPAVFAARAQAMLSNSAEPRS